MKDPLRKQCRFVLVVTRYAMKLLIPSPTLAFIVYGTDNDNIEICKKVEQGLTTKMLSGTL